MLLTDGINPAVWPESTRRPGAPEEVVDFPPHCGLSRRRLLFANIYRPLGKLESSGAPTTSATRDNTTRLASLDIVKGKADLEPLAVEEQLVIDIFVIRRPAEKITIVVVHRAVLPKLAAAVYSPQKKKEEENGKEESSRRVRKSDLFL
ncbi:hypothetical protein LZL87_014395 [Fusarium oxysporum]|nr:hypothetical protein LZL87_014395 [Fusarium oxysporum]